MCTLSVLSGKTDSGIADELQGLISLWKRKKRWEI